MNAGVLMGKLLQVSAGWLYDSKHVAHQLDGEARLDALTDIIDGATGKVDCVRQLPACLARGARSPRRQRHAQGCARLPHAAQDHGGTSPTARTVIFNTFQNNPAHRGPLVVYPTCISHGLTLTAADTVVWFGPPLSAETYDQCNARIRRVGQKHKQLFVHLSSTPIERGSTNC